MKTKTKPNPFTDRYVMCQHCDQTYSASTGEFMTVPDDSPGVLDSGCCGCCQSQPLSVRPAHSNTKTVAYLMLAIVFTILAGAAIAVFVGANF